MSDDAPWAHAMTVAKYGKWGLGALALNHYAWLIYLAFWIAVALVAVAVVVDRVRTHRTLRAWDAHCQDLADQWAATARQIAETDEAATEPCERVAA